ncbi:uncharacterized protein isoform X2 [Musca autumnalis]|uniref:uncharacterized protein isoform X2 n=1 Tax=Musca autumnalis TaxID=221902 RepID=UPI003CE6B119
MKYENCLCFLLSLVVFLNINCNGLCNDDKARSIHLVLTVDLNTDNNNQTTIPIQPNTNNQTHVIPTRNETTTENLNKPAKTLLTLNDCSSLPDNTYLVDSVHCRRFYICQKGRARRQRCSLTQWFDRQALQCRDRKSVTNCPANKP